MTPTRTGHDAMSGRNTRARRPVKIRLFDRLLLVHPLPGGRRDELPAAVDPCVLRSPINRRV